MVDVENAKRLYEKINQFEREGPIPQLKDAAEADALLKEISKDLSNSVKAAEPGVVHAPSPWHAALFLDLIDIQCCMPTATKHSIIEGRGELIESAEKILRFVHRGQRNGTYRLVPSINRPNIDQQSEREAASLLGQVMREYTGYVLRDWEVPMLSPEAFRSTAQHYDIKTSLIDFTPDAAVAVFFANQEQPGGQYPDHGTIFSLELLANERLDNLQVILPPPSTERLYLQRGIFIESTDDLTDACLKVNFKPDSRFQIIRNGKSVDILPADPSLSKAVNFAKENAPKLAAFTKQDTSQLEDLAAQGLHELFAQGRYPTNSLDEMTNWYYGFVDLLNWLGGIYSQESARLNMHADMLNLVCTSNPELVEWAIAFMTIQQKLLKQSPVLDQRALAVLEAAIHNLRQSRQSISRTTSRS